MCMCIGGVYSYCHCGCGGPALLPEDGLQCL